MVIHLQHGNGDDELGEVGNDDDADVVDVVRKEERRLQRSRQ